MDEAHTDPNSHISQTPTPSQELQQAGWAGQQSHQIGNVGILPVTISLWIAAKKNPIVTGAARLGQQLLCPSGSGAAQEQLPAFLGMQRKWETRQGWKWEGKSSSFPRRISRMGTRDVGDCLPHPALHPHRDV